MAETLEQQIGARIRSLRGERGWSQIRMAKELTLCGVEFNPGSLSRLEKGGSNFGISLVIGFAQAFDVAPLYLLFGTDPLGVTQVQTFKKERVAFTDPVDIEEHGEYYFTPKGEGQTQSILSALLWQWFVGGSQLQGTFFANRTAYDEYQPHPSPITIDKKLMTRYGDEIRQRAAQLAGSFDDE